MKLSSRWDQAIRRFTGPFVAVLLLLLSSVPADAGPVSSIRFGRVSLDKGLSQSSVNAVAQDPQGLMWFGTQDGLNRYDGYDFTLYKHDPRDPGSLSNNFVWALHVDRRGSLWVGTERGGLDRWNPDTDDFVHYRNDPADPQSLGHDRVRSIQEGPDGTLWVGTEAGLNRLDTDTGRFTRFSHDDADPGSLSHDQVRCVYVDRTGTLWVGTDGGGLNRFDPVTNRFKHYRHDPADPASLSHDGVRTIAEDAAGRLWIGTYEGGLNRFDRARGEFTRYTHDPDDPNSLSHDRVRSLFEDRQGTLWIGTDGGLNRWRPGSESFVRFRHDASDPASLSSDRILSIHQDRGGLLWVATQAGLNTWNPTVGAFVHYKQDAGAASTLSSKIVTSLTTDPHGTVWIGTYGGGLNAFDRDDDHYTHYRNDPADPGSLSDDRVMSLFVDRDGELWVGTLVGGLNRLVRETGKFEVFRSVPNDPTSLAANGITAITQDRDGVMWVGTHSGGLHRFDRDRGTFVRYRHDPADPTSLSKDRVLSVHADRDGLIWVGTEEGGLDRLDKRTGKFTHFRHDPSDPASLSSDVIWSIHEDRNRVLWIGTQGAGLNRWDPRDRRDLRGVFRHYSERDGLANGFIYGILEDEKGSLWLSTNKGLSRFGPLTGTFTNYDVTHGLQSNEFNFGAFHRASDGEMFFGGSNGFNGFYPAEIKENPHVPPIVLTGILKMNERVTFDTPIWDLERIDLGYRDHVVSFEFSALDFWAPEKNRYAYMLDGFDEDWIELGTMRRATYTNLDAGTYVFRVKGSNNDGVWNDTGVALKVVVIPPPWKTWWAYTLYGAVLVGLGLAYTRAQSRKLEREAEYSRKLEVEVEARTRELASKNYDLGQANAKLEEASVTDALTGLRNRRFLLNYMLGDISLVNREHKDRHAEPPDFLFLMVDLDGFKQINDTYGHAAGDRVLLRVRDIMEKACRGSDIIVRWGGDEFLIVCRNMDHRAAATLAERIRSTITGSEVGLDEGQTARVGCSIGFAAYPFVRSKPDHVAWEKVVAVADRALYMAKTGGRDAWVGIRCVTPFPSEDLVAQILESPEEAARKGFVEVSTSRSSGDVELSSQAK